MNDDFLSRFRQAPRAEFTEALYAKLNRKGKTHQRLNRSGVAKRLTLSLAVLCVLFALTMIVSPAVRAAVGDIIAKITVGGTTVLISEETPTPIEDHESYSLIWTPTTPDDISARYSFYAQLPTWLPSGYELQQQAAIYYTSMFDEAPFSSLFEWKDRAEELIQLQTIKGACPNGPSHDPTTGCTFASFINVRPENEPAVISLNDQPAILYRGVTGLADLSGPTRKWNPLRWKVNRDATRGWSLIWEKEGRTFFLAVESPSITQEDVLRLAESIP